MIINVTCNFFLNPCKIMFKLKMICKLTMPIWISDWLKMNLRVYIGLSLISYIMCIIQYTQLHVYFIQSIFFVLNLFTGITVLLSLTVFMLLVAEIMPATSDSIPLIGKACMWVHLFASLCVVCNVSVFQACVLPRGSSAKRCTRTYRQRALRIY